MEVDFKNCQDINDFTTICRTCLSKDDLYLVSQCNYDEIPIVSLLKMCANVEVVNDHLYPPNICSACLGDLVMAYKFQIKCKFSFDYLNRLLKKTNALTEVYNVPQEDEPISDSNVHFMSCDKTLKDVGKNVENTFSDKCILCAHCGTKFQSKTACWSHMKRAHPGRKVKDLLKDQCGNILSCKKCRRKFTSPSDMKEHQQEDCLTCSVCKTSWKCKSKLETHMRSHDQHKPYLCKLCGKQFTQKPNLKRHMMTHSGERPFNCHICSKGFIQQTTLQEHLKLHNKKRKKRRAITAFKCDYCDRKFKIKLYYQNHLKKTHSEHYKEHNENMIDVFICDKCQKKFTSKKTLKKHMICHGEKLVLCPDCGKEFYTESACNHHQRIHTGEKPFECDVCGKTFRYQSSFDVHKRIHEGVRAYFCKECPKTFIQLGHLNNHVKSIHTSQKSYVCRYCARSFTFKGNLKVHIRMHTGETPYKCPVCGRGFFDSSSRKKHIQRQHNCFETNNDVLGKG